MAKNKTAIAVCAMALAGAIGVGYVAASVATQSWDPAKWVNPKTEITRPADEETSKSWGKAVSLEGEVFDESETYVMPTSFMFLAEVNEYEIATAAYTAPTVTFTAELNNEYLDIPLTFPESTEYLEITTINDNSFSVKCLKPFSVKQTLTVTSSVDSTVNLQCNVDYLKRYAIEEAGISGSGFGSTAGASVSFARSQNIGTVEADTFNLYGYARIADNFVNEFLSLLKFDIEFLTCEIKVNSNQVTYRKPSGNDPGAVYGTSNETIEYSDLIKDFDTYNEQQQNAIKYVWYVMNEKHDTVLIKTDVGFDYILNGKIVYSTRLDSNNHLTSGWDTNFGCPEGEALAPVFTLTPNGSTIF